MIQWKQTRSFILAVLGLAAAGLAAGCSNNSSTTSTDASSAQISAGREIFMMETFGNEEFFGGTLGLHTVLNGVAPKDAVALGVQVDLTKVPEDIATVMTGTDLAAKDTALADPAVTRKLIKAGAIVGVKGFYATTDVSDETMISVGITCGLCHVTVTPTVFTMTSGTVALPIGEPRYDGVPNTGMDAGKILSFTPFAVDNGLSATLAGWGPGKFDIRALNELDDTVDNPTTYPSIWNFTELQAHGYTFGWSGMFSGENALASLAEAIYDLVMHGNGSFGTSSGAIYPPALAFAPRQTVLDNLADNPASIITRTKMLQIQAFLESISSPAPDGFDAAKAAQGATLFNGKAGCAGCHPQTNAFISEGRYTNITATPAAGDLAGGIKVPGLKGISKSAPYFHNGSAPTLLDVVNRFDTRGSLGLTANEKEDLVEYLKSL